MIFSHPNHSAIDIIEVNKAYGYAQIKKCYDNNNRTPIGGGITKFNDNIFNTNVTITPKDSTGINNPNLVNELPNGLYKIYSLHLGFRESKISLPKLTD